jgi:cell division protein FtsB
VSRFRKDWLRLRDRAHSAATAWEFPSDARTIEDHPKRRVDRPDAGRLARARRRVVGIVLATVFVAGSLAAVFGDRGYLELARLEREAAELDARVAEEEALVRELERHVDRLEHDPYARERIARERLGLAEPGELTFLLPGAEAGPDGATRRSRVPPPSE